MAKWDVVLAGYKGDEHYRFLIVEENEKVYALSTRLFGDENNLSEYTRMYLSGIVGEEDDPDWVPASYTNYASEIVGNIGHLIEDDKILEEAIMWLAEPRSAMVGKVSYTNLQKVLEEYPYDSDVVKAKECLAICRQAWKSWCF